MTPLHVHWLIPGESYQLDLLQKADMASVRMRAGLVCKYSHTMGMVFTAGDTVNPAANVVVVGKIGSDCDKGRANHWLAQIRKSNLENKKIIIDYTDNHLDSPGTAMGEFYKLALPFVSKAVVPSRKMMELLRNFFHEEIEIIGDPIEVNITPVKAPKYKDMHSILWFGHSTNIPYLTEYLECKNLCDIGFNLIVLSNSVAIKNLRSRAIEVRRPLQLQIAEWSIANMQYAAGLCDACIIPSNIADPKKSGASSNRLITALALGLPTLAENLSSYMEFQAYYSDIRSMSLSKFFDQIDVSLMRTKKAQDEALVEFMPENLAKLWELFFRSGL